jgi:hypothetical protein
MKKPTLAPQAPEEGTALPSAPEAPASDDRFTELAPLPTNLCADESCGFTAKVWAGRELWACAKCGFQTFDKPAAEERAGRTL